MKIDFTNCKEVLKGYAGVNGTKKAIIYNNEVYMLKFPPLARRNKEISYMNSCISEYVCCKIIKTFDIDVQEVLLGTYKIGDKEKIVVACKDFAYPNFTVQDFALIKNTILSSSQNGYGTDFYDMLNVIEEQKFLDKNIVLERFWDMFIIDCLLANFDRHNGNWGYLSNSNLTEIKLAPIYDCGSCLYPQNSDAQMEKILEDEKLLEDLIYSRPKSVFSIDNVKINYYDFLMNTDNKECLRSLNKIFNKIDIKKINEIIDNVPYITRIHKDFMKKIIKNRKEKILFEAIKNNKNISEL